MTQLQGRRVTVMGLGLAGGGAGSARFFSRKGARVTVTDLKGEEELSESVSALNGLDIEFHLGGHSDGDFVEADMVVASPAVRLDSPYLELASSRGVPVECPMTLFFLWCPAPITGVTGTLGKTTITALIGHIMSGTEKKTWIGGNIGKNPLDFVEDVGPNDVVVLEISSFQLEYLGRCGLSPHVAVVTGISSDHMDRYGSMEEYAFAKKNILKYQVPDDVAFLHAACGTVRNWGDDCLGTAYLYDARDIASLPGLKIPGNHNRANAAAAAAVSTILGASMEKVKEGLSTFKGVEYRMEYVAEKDGVRFYDDSAATTPEAAVAAINAVEAPITLILGGSDKGLDMSGLIAACVEKVERVVLIGEATESLMNMFRACNESYAESHVSTAVGLNEAVKAAAGSLQGGSVLLSPAHASFDMFRNYMDRGDSFKQVVYSLSSS